MKFFVKDEEGNKFEVEQVEEKKEELEQPQSKKDEVPTLSDEEILALRSLAAHAEEIIKLLSIEEKEHEATNKEEGEEGDDEEIVDTDKEAEKIVKMATDSRKSIGATIVKKPVVADSVDTDEEINAAWAKRLGGNK